MLSVFGTCTNLQGPQPAQYLKDRLDLEGQCKIESFIFLKLCWIKGIILFILLFISVIGLLILKYSKRLRTKVFYTLAPSQHEATHIFIKGNSKSEQIIICLLKQGKSSFFFYRQLKYQLIEGQPYPVGMDFETYLRENLSDDYLKEGLKLQSVNYNSKLYGKNEHIVDPPTYLQYLYDVLTEPFFFIQYLAAVIYIIQGLSTLTFLLIGTSLITTTINYIILYLSYRKIKEMAEVIMNVQILREGQFKELPSNQLIPGDLFIPKEQLFCDAILLKGQIYANEANLTGQSVPIAKFGLEEFKNYQKGDSRIWLYEGSKILSSHNGIAVVINTGYSSKRGRILRKMLIRNIQQPHFFKSYIYFVLLSYIIGVIAYLATLSLRLDTSNGGIDRIFILLNFLLIVTFCFPPSAAVYFNLVYSFSLIRLKFNNILGTQPQKTVQSTHLKIICFDKTGTLTVDKMQVNRIITFQLQSYRTLTKQQNRLALDFKLFGCCHTVRQFEEKLQGDEIDLKTFECSGFKLLPSSQQSVCFEVREDFGLERLRVLKIFQYESKFQSMAVLAHDKQTSKYYIFTKGAPEIIHNYSKVKYSYFQALLQSQSYSGFRTIGYGYKQIPKQSLQQCLRDNRESYMKDITMLGLLVFENKLKPDSKQTIQQLRIADISPRMITGDNIYIAIETSMRCGILSRTEQVCVLQGKHQNILQGQREEQLTLKAKFLKFQNQQARVREQSLSYEEYLHSNYSIIIDNDFLKLYSRFTLSQSIKVFARISPENKAFIVRSIRKNLQSQSKATNWIDKLLSQQTGKVGMVGDGANDLLAIKQANIGIGISNCDSSYAASFSVNCLKDIGYLIRQAKCSQREIIEICRYISISGILNIPQIVIMELEGAYFSPLQMAINNFSKSLILPILVALSRPSTTQTSHKPCSNFLQRQNQLAVWGNVLLSTLVISANYIYYSQTDEYIKNTKIATMQTGWSFNNSLVASQYLYTSIQPVILSFCLYSGNPWKQPVYKNIPLFIVILLNVFYQTTLYFIQPYLADFLGMPKISYPCLIKLLIISSIGNVLVILWSKMIELLRLHEKRKICLQKTQIGQTIRTGSSSQNRTQY